MEPQTKLFIGGEFVDALEGGTVATLNPHDNSLIADVAEARAADVDRAVEGAGKAFPAWSAMSGMDRGRLLLKLADAIEADAENLARLESLDTGHPLRDTRSLDVPRTAVTFRYFGGMADKFEGTVVPVEAGFLNYVLREPVGVVGQIVPWNFPLMFTSWKMGPALAAGCTVVLKPSELTPLTTLRIAELMRDVGFAAGVVNIVPGYGATAGQRLVDHPEVRKIAFTGSTAIGRGVVRGSAGNLKKVQLELGGKGANVVFDDANIVAAVNGAAFAIFHNQGQACIAGSRLLLHEKIADEFLDHFLALARSIKLGDPLSEATEMGPLTSRQHQQRVLDYCAIAREEGGEILTGGRAPDDPALAKGCYVEPTVVRADPHSRVCREEVFGPFVAVSTFKTEEEALAIANGTEYGLGGGLWTGNLQRAHRFAKAMISGMVWVNCYKRVNPGSPFGGVHASGYGREMGFEAMREYTSPKSVWVNVDAQLPPTTGGEAMAKIMPLADAVGAFVKDGDTVAMEGFTHLIPHAAGHEIIRQGRTDLTLIRMTPDLIYDQLIGMGAARKLVFSWGGNPGVGSLHRFRDAVERGWPRPLEIEERAHADMASSYASGASGLPFSVLRAYAGTDIPKHNPNIRSITCPFTGETLAASLSIRPDVAVIHAQKADRKGNVLLWGILGVQKEVVLAARRAIVTVEEVVDDLGADPARNAVILPSWVISAVSPVPGGAAPSYAHGYYERDNSFYKKWDAIARDRDAFVAWMREHIIETKDFDGFLKRQAERTHVAA